MAKDIAQWLNRLGLGQYAQAFADNGIDIGALPHLRDETLTGLGCCWATCAGSKPPSKPYPPTNLPPDQSYPRAKTPNPDPPRPNGAS